MDLDAYSPYVQNMTVGDRISYLKKLCLKNGARLPDPHSTPICDWSADITKLPDINWMDIQTYLIDTPSEFTKDSLKAWRSLEAYDYYVCGHVQVGNFFFLLLFKLVRLFFYELQAYKVLQGIFILTSYDFK